ncbi:hypothetical protein OG871_37585 [Kitasatospora sp. NBC_00374]
MADPSGELVGEAGRIGGLGPAGDRFVVLQLVDEHRHGSAD